MINREPKISPEGIAAWTFYQASSAGSALSHIAVYDARKKELNDKSLLLFTGSAGIDIFDERIVFVSGYFDLGFRSPPREGPLAALRAKNAGEEPALDATNLIRFDMTESNKTRDKGDGTYVWSWTYGASNIEQMPTENLSNVSPTAWENRTVWQWEQTWPFGYEIMAKSGENVVRLTDDRNYDLKPELHGSKVVWYGWDGYDYEIFMYDFETGTKSQLTDNRFDDIGPQIWNDIVVWEGYPGVEADIFLWKNGEIIEISDNLEDDLYPRIWDRFVVWQGFDGDDFEIYAYDVDAGGEAVKMTSNNFDDANPEISDGLLVWLGYHDNWDSEIYAAELPSTGSLTAIDPLRLTDNDTDDLQAHTAGRRIIWVSDETKKPQIMLAEPR